MEQRIEGAMKVPTLQPTLEWERAYTTMNQAHEELAMIREDHNQRQQQFEKREYELQQIVAAGKSVTEYLANWAPQDCAPSPEPPMITYDPKVAGRVSR